MVIENLTITITQCMNGILIKKDMFLNGAHVTEHWVAHEAGQVRDIVYDLLPKG